MKKQFLKFLMICAAAGMLSGCGGDDEKNVSVTGVSLSESSISIEAGSSYTLTATITPKGATNKKVYWSSSDSGIATVSGGTVYAKSKVTGDCTITVKTADGNHTDTCSVHVYRVID